MTDKLQCLMNAAARIVTVVHISLTTVCHDSCTTICTGLTFLNVSSTRLASQCSTVCRVGHPSTWLTVALHYQRLLADATYTRPVHISCLYHVTSSVPSVVELSLLQSWRSGTLPDSLRDPALSSSNFSNYSRRTCSTVIQHIQCSRDAVWLCAI